MDDRHTKSESDIHKITGLATPDEDKIDEPLASLRELYQYLDCFHIVLF